jgi:hypothetical protein
MSLIRPEPLPDELVNGYAGRIKQRNGWTDEKSTLRELLCWSGCQGQTLRDVPPVELLARVAGMDLRTFVHGHSLLPLRRAITRNSPGELLGGARQAPTLWSLAMRPMRSHAYFCPRCVDEDIGFHGESYWRREHQIPGRNRCVKHEFALSYVSLPRAYQTSPAARLGVALRAPHGGDEQSDSSIAIESYLDICSFLLHIDNPRDELAVSRHARAKARDMGFHVGKGVVNKPLVSDQLKQCFDGAWLESVMPGLMKVPEGRFWPPVDGGFQGKRAGLSVIAYALVFAVLYDCADAAANAITSAELYPTTRRRPVKVVRVPTNEQLRTSYIARSGSHATVANDLGVDPVSVSTQLTRQGLPRLGNMATERLEQIVQALLIENMPLDEACRKSKMSEAAVRRALLAALTPMRTALTEMASIEGSRDPEQPLVKFRVRERLA